MEQNENIEYVISDELIAELREQFRVWAAFLNSGIGLMSFTLAIASLGTATPWFNALLSMILVLMIRVMGRKFFPSKIDDLRKKAKNNDKARVLLNGLQSEFLSFKALLKGYPVFLFGYLFLCFVIFSPFIGKYITVVKNYVGT